ncbi:aminotransferase class IV [Acetobacter sp. TBRC 12305]|uniref:Probable branched-chain-amino-acid aminotransferase n=1 Tax=Acetobacter garciniae TaxID=2817435 RepID=A0A939HJV8_9PROT|nr:aminotransferase class IV [Acetobacter garciniae]MBO1324782.1 aminotransferase class IV [Acetobacter garciniae]MBX0344473.1 aminotransferase class IV [Acetobacter garciniae]
MSEDVFLNGRFLSPAEATLSVFDRGFLFGEGIYEVWAVVGQRIVDTESHLKRLDRSLAECGLPTPPERDTLPQILTELVRRGGLTDGFIYLQITPGAGERDFTGTADTRPTLFIMARKKDLLGAPALESGMAVDLVPDIRWLRRDIKTTMLMPQVMAKKNAVRQGLKDAVFYDETGITEGASSNIFIVTESGAVRTRPLSHKLLPGCTRGRIVALARDHGIQVHEQAFSVEELLTAREAFVTSATSLIVPIIQVNEKTIADGKPGPVTRTLQKLYIDYIHALPPCA